jgi:hypothetical protein
MDINPKINLFYLLFVYVTGIDENSRIVDIS